MKALQQKRWNGFGAGRGADGGTGKIEVLNNADMGDGHACLEQLQYGGTDIVKVDVSALGNFVEEFNVLGMPYIYEDPEHFWAVHNGPIGEELLKGAQMAELGMYGLTYYDGGSRCFYSSRGEIHSPGDLEGLAVRVQQSETALSIGKSTGGKAGNCGLFRTVPDAAVKGGRSRRKIPICKLLCSGIL